jgi:hypothetical protein
MAALTEKQALDFFLAEFKQGPGPTSNLELALRDARTAMANKALWLAALGYLVTVEVVGRTLARPNTAFPNRKKDSEYFRAGLLEFAPHPVSDRARGGFWNLRCGLAHHYQLRDGDHRFTLAEWGPIWAQPSARGEPEWVNLAALGEYVEALVRNARHEHQSGSVRLRRAPGDVLESAMVIRHDLQPPQPAAEA